MSPQDLIFLVGSFVLSVCLIPTLRSTFKPPVWTSLPTALVLVTYGSTMLSLGLYLSAVGMYAGAALWFALVFQRLSRDRHKQVLASTTAFMTPNKLRSPKDLPPVPPPPPPARPI